MSRDHTVSSLEASTEEYAAFQQETRSFFELLAARLPAVHDEVARLDEELHRLDERAQGRGLGELLARREAQIERMQQVVGAVLTENEEIATRVLENAAQLEAIATGLGPIKALSNAIRLMALNASFTAAQCGDEARAFNVLTGALGALSRAFQDQASAIREKSDGIDEHIQRASTLRDGVRQDLEQVLRQSIEELGSGSLAIVEVIRAALGEVAEAAAEVQELSEPLQLLLRATQREEDLCQGMDQVLSMGHEVAVADEGTPETQRLRERGAELMVRLIEGIDEDLGGVLGEAGGELGRLTELIRGFRSRADRLVRELELQQQLERLVQSATDGLDRAKGQVGMISHYTGLVEAVRRNTEELARELGEFESLIRELRMLNTMMKIEIGRTPGLSGAVNLTASISDAVSSFVEFVGDFRQKTGEILSRLKGTSGAIDEVVERAGKRFGACGAEFGAFTDGLRVAAGDLGTGIGAIAETVGQVKDLVDELELHRGSFASRAADKGDLAERCRELAQRAEGAQFEGDAAVEETLQQLIAGRASLVRGEVAGDAAGELASF